MRIIRLAAHLSLDGVITPAGPNLAEEFINGGWSSPYRSPQGAAALLEAQGQGYDLLLGRHTYDLWSTYWPKQTGGPFASAINGATKYVATHRPESLEWGPIGDLGPDAIAGIRQLKASDGPDLLIWGSTTLTPTLLAEGLVDELILVIYPVLLGDGKRPFTGTGAPRNFTLISSQSTPTGVVLSVYRQLGVIQ